LQARTDTGAAYTTELRETITTVYHSKSIHTAKGALIGEYTEELREAITTVYRERGREKKGSEGLSEQQEQPPAPTLPSIGRGKCGAVDSGQKEQPKAGAATAVTHRWKSFVSFSP